MKQFFPKVGNFERKIKSIYSMEFHLPWCMFFSLWREALHLLFFLIKKSNKKIKANPNAPLDLPLVTHKLQNYRCEQT